MNTAHLHLPDGRRVAYTIQTSTRARCVRLKLSVQEGLVVVKPASTSTQYVIEWVNSKAAWVAKHLPVETLTPPAPEPLPEQIVLPAVQETWQLVYQSASTNGVTLRSDGKGTLTLAGMVEERALCHSVLQRWLQRHAKLHLGQWLQQLAEETGLRYTACSVKGQRSRWGSCSNLGNINLNYKLLLLPPEWVRYTLIHELCHTLEMNHSKRFWALVETFSPDYETVHSSMRGAMGRLPKWANPD
jgi:hypothetical protein